MDTLRQLSRPICTFLFLALCIFASIPLRGGSQSDYFSDPMLFSTEELAKELKKKTLDMCWERQDSHFRFVSGNDEVYFEVQLGTLPDIYGDFVARVKHRFMSMKRKNSLFFPIKLKMMEMRNLIYRNALRVKDSQMNTPT